MSIYMRSLVTNLLSWGFCFRYDNNIWLCSLSKIYGFLNINLLIYWNKVISSLKTLSSFSFRLLISLVLGILFWKVVCHPKNNAHCVSCDQNNSLSLMTVSISSFQTLFPTANITQLSVKAKGLHQHLGGEMFCSFLLHSLCSISLELMEALQCWEINKHCWSNSEKSNLV